MRGALGATLFLLFAARGSAAVSQTEAGHANIPRADCRDTRRLRISGSELRLQFDADDFALSEAQICAWTGRAAEAVTAYFDGFPVPAVRIVFRPADSGGVTTGSTYQDLDGKGPVIFIELGRRADQAALDRDWVLPHELTHLAVPSVPRRSHWLEEGIATYVEPVARAQLGQLGAEKVWADMFRGMHNGLPRAGDRGLDRTPSWGRVYWGGALFCLLADVAIRERTDNRKSLRDALRGVRAAGGNIEQDWSVARVLEAGDRAVGVPVLSELYGVMGNAPGLQDLDALWQGLGIASSGPGVKFVAGAPLAAIRGAITARDSVDPRGLGP